MNATARLIRLDARLERVVAFIQGDELTKHMAKYPAYWNARWPEATDRAFLKRSIGIPSLQRMNASTQAIRHSGVSDLLHARAQGLR